MTKVRRAIRVASLCFFLITIAAAQGYQPTNILTNGDFSKGLSCYSMWSCGASGSCSSASSQYAGPDWDPGTWMFYLKNDSPYPGGHSGEIICNGSRCDSYGRIFTAPIPVDKDSLTGLSKSYRLTAYYKCANGGTGQIYVTDDHDTHIIGNDSLSCTGSWQQVSFQTFTPPQNSATMKVVASSDHGTSFFEITSLVLTYSDNTVPYQYIAHTGIRGGLGVNSSGPVPYVLVDSQPYLALGFYGLPPVNYPDALSYGINTVLSDYSATPTDKCFNTAPIPPLTQTDYRDYAYEHGLNLLPDSIFAVRSGVDNNGSFGDNGTGAEAVFPAIATTYAPHLANIGWLLADEPDFSDVGWFYIASDEFKKLVGIASQQTALPLFTVFQHPAFNPLYDIKPYDVPPPQPGGSVQVWGAEPYGDDWDGNGTFIRVDNSIQAFTAPGVTRRPIWLALDQNFDQQNQPHLELIVPKAYYSVINGVTGLLYFDWKRFNTNPGGIQIVQNLFAELRQLSSPILSGTTVNVTSQEALPVMGRKSFIQTKNEWDTYVIAVNLKQTSLAAAHYTITGLQGGLTIDVDFGSYQLQSTPGGFVDDHGFPSLSRHVYRIIGTN